MFSEGKYSKQTVTNRATKQLKISVLGSGTVFGEADLIKSQPYSSSLMCSINDSVVYILPKSEFERICFSKSDVYLKILNIVKQKAVTQTRKYRQSLTLNRQNADRTAIKGSIKNNLLMD